MDPSFQGEFFYIFLMGADLLLSVFSCAVSCDTAKDRKVCHSISAQTVVSMHAASDFAGCKEPFDYVAFCIKDLCLIIDSDPTHGVVDTRLNLDRVEGCLIQRICKGNTAIRGMLGEKVAFIRISRFICLWPGG